MMPILDRDRLMRMGRPFGQVAQIHPHPAMSGTEAYARKLPGSPGRLLKNSCRSESDPFAVIASTSQSLAVNPSECIAQSIPELTIF